MIYVNGRRCAYSYSMYEGVLLLLYSKWEYQLGDLRAVTRWDRRLQRVLIISSSAWRTKRRPSALQPQMSDCSEGDVVKTGQWVIQGYPISNSPQTFRNADRPEAAVIWPFDPLQLFGEAITWRVTSGSLTKEETGGKRSRAGGSADSESCFINCSSQTENRQVWRSCSFDEFSLVAHVFLLGSSFIHVFYLPLKGFLFRLTAGFKVGYSMQHQGGQVNNKTVLEKNSYKPRTLALWARGVLWWWIYLDR